MGILYDQHGVLDMNDAIMRDVVAEQLNLKDVDEFFSILAPIGLIDLELYRSMNHVANKGVCDQLEYKRQKSEAGKLGGKAARSKTESKKKSKP